MDEGGESSSAPLGWGVAFVPIAGEEVSGDQHLVVPNADGHLIAVVDGLGHGPEAAEASEAAVDVLVRHADEPVTTLVQRCHEALRRTRGAAMSIATIDAPRRRLEWIGIGNVEGRLLRASPGAESGDEVLLLRGGVVGYQLPALQPDTVALLPGDTLVMVSDGLNPAFADGIRRHASPQPLAEDLLAKHAKGTDDALALVVRYGAHRDD